MPATTLSRAAWMHQDRRHRLQAHRLVRAGLHERQGRQLLVLRGERLRAEHGVAPRRALAASPADGGSADRSSRRACWRSCPRRPAAWSARCPRRRRRAARCPGCRARRSWLRSDSRAAREATGRRPCACRASAMKPATARCSSRRCQASARSAGSLSQRQYGNGASSRREERRKHLVEVALDHFLVRFERVDVDAEGEPGGDIHRVAHQVGLQVDRSRRPRPRAAIGRRSAA